MAADEEAADNTTSTLPLVQPYRYFVGDWGACSSTCGLSQRTREVYCARTCSLYRCPSAANGFCANLSTPVAFEGVTLPVGNYECLMVVGGDTLPGGCLAASQTICGPTCPCCRQRATLAPPPVVVPPRPVPVPAPAPDGGGEGLDSGEAHLSIVWTVVLVVAVGLASTLVLGLGYAVLRASRRPKAPPVASKPPPFVKRNTASSSRVFDDRDRDWDRDRERSVPEAWPSWENEAWAEPVHSFEDPPTMFGRTTSSGGIYQEAASEDPFAASFGSTASAGGPGSAGHQQRASSTGPEGGPQPQPQPQRQPRSSSSGSRGSSRGGASASAGADSGGAARSPPHAKRAKTESFHHGSASPQRARSEDRPHRVPRSKTSGASPSSGAAGGAAGGAEGTEGADPSSPGGAQGGQANSPPPRKEATGPGSASPGGGGGAAGGASPPQSPPAAAAPEEKDPVIAELVAKLDAELDAAQGKDLETRRQHFKSLMLTWHPDKNRTASPEQAAAVFRHLLARRGRYLEA